MFGIVCGDRLVFSSSSNGFFSSFSEEKFVLTNCSSFSNEFVVLQNLQIHGGIDGGESDLPPRFCRVKGVL